VSDSVTYAECARLVQAQALVAFADIDKACIATTIQVFNESAYKLSR
jgi:hypothetical protein